MRYYLLLLLVLASMMIGKAQDELPVNDAPRVEFKPGIYLTFDDFIYNNPVSIDEVEGDLERFFVDPMNAKTLVVKRNLSVQEVQQSDVWGYTDGKNVFLNRVLFEGMPMDWGIIVKKADGWVKIQTFGTLSYLTFITTKYHQTQNGTGYATGEEKNFILNAEDGKFYKANLKELKGLLTNDPELLSEFEKAGGNKQVKLFTYLKKYNERHPFQFR